MSLPDVKGLDTVADGVPFVKIDLTQLSDNLDVAADGVPWVGYQEPASASVIFAPIWWVNILEAI